MIKDRTIDQCLVELARTMAALKALRAERKADPSCSLLTCSHCFAIRPATVPECKNCGAKDASRFYAGPSHRKHAAALRASLDLTRKLADLRQGR